MLALAASEKQQSPRSDRGRTCGAVLALHGTVTEVTDFTQSHGLAFAGNFCSQFVRSCFGSIFICPVAFPPTNETA